MQYIFFGRLEKEKGADLILKLPKYFPNIKIWVFGKGSLEKDFKENFSNKNQKFFGWTDKKTIQKYLKKSDICLMPSRFLETFGLTALESISLGVPIIGFNKGGLSQFLHPQLKINSDKDFFKLIKKLENKEIDLTPIKEYSLKIAKKYLKNNFIKNLNHIIPPNTKKIILVSDYLTKIGGIENYIFELKNLLEKEFKIKTILFGYKKKLNKINKLILLLKSFYNPLDKYKLEKLTNEYKPDIIRYHSISRNLGAEILNINFNGYKFFTFHDLGYFAPFASKVYDLTDLVLPWTFENYLSKLVNFNTLEKSYGILKYFKLNKIRKNLIKNIDLFIIPSTFMKDIVNQWGIPSEKIYTLPHFINK